MNLPPDITPDDVEDTKELIHELESWIRKRKKRWKPYQMSVLLVYEGCKIAFIHAPDKDAALSCVQRSIVGAIEMVYGSTPNQESEP